MAYAVHPGRILRDEFLAPLDISSGALAKHIDVPRTRIERLVREETSMTVDTALRLSAAFKTTPQFWMNMQVNYDLAASKAAESIKPLDGVAA